MRGLLLLLCLIQIFVLFSAILISPMVSFTRSQVLFLTGAFVGNYVQAFQNPSFTTLQAVSSERGLAFSPLRRDIDLTPAFRTASNQVQRMKPLFATLSTRPTFLGMETMQMRDDFGSTAQQRQELKLKLFALSAACDRGFGAVPSDKAEIERIVMQLKKVSPIKNPTKNLYPLTTSPLDPTPLEGAWRMVYTSALDVLSLAANPLAIVQSVYQCFYRDGSAVNVINLAPRFQALLPSSIVGEGSTVRLKVMTKAFARNESRIGLSFRRVEVKPMKLFNRDVTTLLPPLGATLPQTTLFGAAEDIGLLYEKNSPGYFDVLYLDEDCLIIQQAQPGGIFVSIRSPEPIDSFL